MELTSGVGGGGGGVCVCIVCTCVHAYMHVVGGFELGNNRVEGRFGE